MVSESQCVRSYVGSYSYTMVATRFQGFRVSGTCKALHFPRSADTSLTDLQVDVLKGHHGRNLGQRCVRSMRGHNPASVPSILGGRFFSVWTSGSRRDTKAV